LKDWNVQLTYQESIAIGIPHDKKCPLKDTPDYNPVCRDTNVLLDNDMNKKDKPKLFVPTGDVSIFNPDFIRCPERVCNIAYNMRHIK